MKKARLKKADRNHSPSVGKGRGSHSKLAPLEEVPCGDQILIWQLQGRLGETRCYRMGGCFVMNSLEPVTGLARMGYHMSMSHPKRYPTWDEIAKARYELIPNEVEMVMVLPPKERYINIHEYCLQLWDLEAAFLRWKNGDVL